ncbi:putative reverse transcriptase domain-containing protein [Tanacetum coccineum]
MPSHSSNRRNNGADPAFSIVVEQAVAALLPTLTAWIIDEIRQNKNNGNNDNKRNARRGNFGYFPYSEKEKCEREYKSIRQLAGESSNDFIKRFLKGLRWAPSQIMKETTKGTETANAYDHQNSQRKGLVRGFMIKGIVTDMATVADIATKTNIAVIDGVVIDKAVIDRREYSDYASSPPYNLCGKFHPGKAYHRATGTCFTCGEVGNLAKDCKKCCTRNAGSRNNKPHATRGRVFTLTIDQVANAPGTKD